MTCWFTGGEGGVAGGAGGCHGSVWGLPGAGWLQLRQQPGGEGGAGGGSGHLHSDHQDAAAAAEVAVMLSVVGAASGCLSCLCELLQVPGGAQDPGRLPSGDLSVTLTVGPKRWNHGEFSQLPSFLVQVQLFPSTFFSVFCRASAPLTAQTVSRLFSVNFSEDQERLNEEMPIISFWRHFLLECEGNLTSISSFHLYLLLAFFLTVAFGRATSCDTGIALDRNS